MIVGHTKFSLDRHFGTIKKLLKRIGCASILDLLRALGLIKKSAQDNEVMTYRDPITGEKNFEGFKFDEFLSKKYRPCRGIHEWHIIQIDQDSEPIFVANHAGAPFEEYNNTISSQPLEGIPNILQPNGISETRQGQLSHFESFILSEH